MRSRAPGSDSPRFSVSLRVTGAESGPRASWTAAPRSTSRLPKPRRTRNERTGTHLARRGRPEGRRAHAHGARRIQARERGRHHRRRRGSPRLPVLPRPLRYAHEGEPGRHAARPEAAQGRRPGSAAADQVRRDAEADSRRGAHLLARGAGHGVELPARGERLCSEAGRFPRVRQCDQGARGLLGDHQRAAAGKRAKGRLNVGGATAAVRSPLRILHLEDDPNDAEIVQGVLESGGIACQVTRVETRDEFIASLDDGGFDLILADFSLPSFDGLSALRLALERCPDVPFVFVSGTLGEDVAIEAVKMGAMVFVLKERLSRIVSSVHRALREAAERAERKHAAQQLRRSEAFLVEGQRISHTGSWGKVVSSGRITWSAELYRMLGYEPAKVEPSLALFLGAVHPEDRARVRHDIEEATAAKHAYAINYRVVLPGGGIRHLRSVGRPVPTETGEVDEYIGTSTDITERVQAEAALRARQEMLDLAQKAARAVAFEWRLGADECEKWRSLDLDRMFGLAPGTYGGTFEAWKALVHPGDRQAVTDAMAHASESGEVAVEYRVVHPDGAVRWLQAKGRMFFDDQDRPARVVGFMLDVTERREAEEELRRLESRLRQAQRLEAMGTLAGGIAHDFNNILGAILGYGERALRAAEKGSRLRRDLDSIMAAGERGRALVDRVLAFTRSSASERVAVHVERVVREVIDLIEAKLPEGIRVESELRAGS